MKRPSGPTDRDPIITLIVRQPGLSARLLAQHADDGHGRCQVCSSGAQSAHTLFPCSLHTAAERAQAIERERSGQGRRKS